MLSRIDQNGISWVDIQSPSPDEISKLALLTFPLTLIATIFTIDSISRPIVGRPNDFWIIIGLMAIIVAAMLLFFKHRRWI